jgi:UDP-N-acetyl-D-galactosamine dehydrogenase
MVNKKNFVAVVGLGYVGLPISLALAKKIPTIGFDLSKGRIK